MQYRSPTRFPRWPRPTRAPSPGFSWSPSEALQPSQFPGASLNVFLLFVPITTNTIIRIHIFESPYASPWDIPSLREISPLYQLILVPRVCSLGPFSLDHTGVAFRNGLLLEAALESYFHGAIWIEKNGTTSLQFLPEPLAKLFFKALRLVI